MLGISLIPSAMHLKSTCIHCGVDITAITRRINDGFCMVCCDVFPGIKGTKHLLDVVSEAEVDTELAARGTDTGATFHRWLRIKSRLEPGDRLVRFCSDLQSPVPVVAHGVVWRRAGLELSGVVTLTQWLTAKDEWIGEKLRFATQDARSSKLATSACQSRLRAAVSDGSSASLASTSASVIGSSKDCSSNGMGAASEVTRLLPTICVRVPMASLALALWLRRPHRRCNSV